jgi:hypothetical protein
MAITKCLISEPLRSFAGTINNFCNKIGHKPTPLAQTKPRREAGVQLKKGL